MAADYFISLSKKLRFFCQLFSRVYLIIMFYFFSLEKMLETPKFSFFASFFPFYYFCKRFNFPSLILRNSSCFLHVRFPLKFCAGNWRTAGQNRFICSWWTFDRCVIGARLTKLDSFAHVFCLAAVCVAIQKIS